MKTLKYLFTLLIILPVLTSCSDDDGESYRNSLEGTQWSCVSEATGEAYSLEISASTCNIAILDPDNGDVIASGTDIPYTYDPQTGTGHLTFNGYNITFKLVNGSLVVSVNGQSLSFTETTGKYMSDIEGDWEGTDSYNRLIKVKIESTTYTAYVYEGSDLIDWDVDVPYRYYSSMGWYVTTYGGEKTIAILNGKTLSISMPEEHYSVMLTKQD